MWGWSYCIGVAAISVCSGRGACASFCWAGCGGGICLPPPKSARGAGAITAVELATGLLVNRDFSVWDYRGQPGNVLGQICPMFMALWVPLSAAGMALYGWTERRLDQLAGNR